MTTEAQKQGEARYVAHFLRRFDGVVKFDGGERPDFWVRRSPPPDNALEVTEYHSQPAATGDFPRVAVEAIWWKDMEPIIERARKARPILEGARVHFNIAANRLPKRTERVALAEEMVRLAEAAVQHAEFCGDSIDVEFMQRETIAAVGTGAGVDGAIFLPEEDWPLCFRFLQSFEISQQATGVQLPWHCLNATAAWVGPEVEELRRILETKTKKAKTYTVGESPLWLLIVCEVAGDLESHIFPRDSEGQNRLDLALEQTGFDFGSSPFSEVWLFSAFADRSVRLHPPDATK